MSECMTDDVLWAVNVICQPMNLVMVEITIQKRNNKFDESK